MKFNGMWWAEVMSANQIADCPSVNSTLCSWMKEKTGIMLDSCKEINFTKHNLEILTVFAFGSAGKWILESEQW